MNEIFDTERFNRIQSGEAFDSRASKRIGDLHLMSVEELLNLRGEIDRLLPATSLGDMNLERELVLQYQKMVFLQENVLNSDNIPANQIAQVANSVAAVLQQLVNMQAKHHTSERLKEIEARLIKALEHVPREYLEKFFEWYETEA